jgi:hypothetical protein
VPVVSGTGHRDVTGLLQLLQYLKTRAAVKRLTPTQAMRLLLLLLPPLLLLVVLPFLKLPTRTQAAKLVCCRRFRNLQALAPARCWNV